MGCRNSKDDMEILNSVQRSTILLELQHYWKNLSLPGDVLKIVEAYITVAPVDEIKEAFLHDPERAKGLADMVTGAYNKEKLFASLPALENVPLAVYIGRKWNLNGPCLLASLMRRGMWNDEMEQWRIEILKPAGVKLCKQYDANYVFKSYYRNRPWLECNLSLKRTWRFSNQGIEFRCGCFCPLHKWSCKGCMEIGANYQGNCRGRKGNTSRNQQEKKCVLHT